MNVKIILGIVLVATLVVIVGCNFGGNQGTGKAIQDLTEIELRQLVECIPMKVDAKAEFVGDKEQKGSDGVLSFKKEFTGYIKSMETNIGADFTLGLKCDSADGSFSESKAYYLGPSESKEVKIKPNVKNSSEWTCRVSSVQGAKIDNWIPRLKKNS
ncbi:MAG TPA: hypothetical protein VJH20_00645 [Candidatus Nanoarchaeia archaeon]|nr:hypothetical protein [Candidatus Nanoarchaeia archaeon]